MTHASHNTTPEITATLVPDEVRMNMLPKYFEKKYLIAEHTIYTFMKKMCNTYRGAFWDYYELSNGGFFMSLPGDEPMTLTSFGMERDYEVSPLAAGIAACLHTFSHMSFDDEDGPWAELFHNLRDYTAQLPESAKIAAIID